MIQVMDRFEEEKETMAAAYAAKMDQMMGKNKDVMELEADLGVPPSSLRKTTRTDPLP